MSPHPTCCTPSCHDTPPTKTRASSRGARRSRHSAIRVPLRFLHCPNTKNASVISSSSCRRMTYCRRDRHTLLWKIRRARMFKDVASRRRLLRQRLHALECVLNMQASAEIHESVLSRDTVRQVSCLVAPLPLSPYPYIYIYTHNHARCLEHHRDPHMTRCYLPVA